MPIMPLVYTFTTHTIIMFSQLIIILLDLPVGAYASNQAVLIPGRPVIALQMNAEAEPKLINPRVANCRYGKTSDQATCVAIGVVFKYTGERLPDGLCKHSLPKINGATYLWV